MACIVAVVREGLQRSLVRIPGLEGGDGAAGSMVGFVVVGGQCALFRDLLAQAFATAGGLWSSSPPPDD